MTVLFNATIHVEVERKGANEHHLAIWSGERYIGKTQRNMFTQKQIDRELNKAVVSFCQDEAFEEEEYEVPCGYNYFGDYTVWK